MKKSIVLSIFALNLISVPFVSRGGNRDSTVIKNRNVIWFVPSEARYINGLSLGLFNSPPEYKQTINGINVELIGAGALLPFVFMDDQQGYSKRISDYLKNNGLTLGLTLYSGKVNGVSVSGLINGTNYLNGFSFSTLNCNIYGANGIMAGVYNYSDHIMGMQAGFWNKSNFQTGVQIGLINIADELKGFQFGLWNKNGKRSLPFINWQFKPTKKE